MQAPAGLELSFNRLECADVQGNEKAVSDTDGVSEKLSAASGSSTEESRHAVRYRTCSWQKASDATAALLFSEYICLAILSFPWSFSILGLVPGILLTIAVAATVQYTSLIIWRLCLKYPEIRDVCDVGRVLFGGSELAYWLTSIMFVLSNVFGQAFHVLVGAELLNTLSDSGACTMAFTVVTAVLCFLVSLPRTLNRLGALGTVSAVSMGVAILLTVVFSGAQPHPVGYTGAAPLVTAWPIRGTTFINGMSAFLNISYTLIGQITVPSFIAEMKNPRDFPKALWVSTVCEVIILVLAGSLVYHYTGNQYVVAPSVGSLQPPFKKIAFSFAIPTIIYLGSLYSSVTARFVFFRMFHNSAHKHSNGVVAWTVWAGIIGTTWVLAWIIAEAIPFFSDMLSLTSSLFDSWFGFTFWGMAYLLLYPGESRWAGPWRSAETLVNYFFIVFGFYVLGAGTYVAVQSIIDSYRMSLVGSPFTCRSNAV
ncbi:hypothetical protein BDW22DRAFT_1401827 [Trametopsis cervina]|nr:hypothetical protein BDW22DRAFT_1401827 [Trametopsis cervina]